MPVEVNGEKVGERVDRRGMSHWTVGSERERERETQRERERERRRKKRKRYLQRPMALTIFCIPLQHSTVISCYFMFFSVNFCFWARFITFWLAGVDSHHLFFRLQLN